MSAICPACGSPRTKAFYQAGQVPVHSTLLMPTREVAEGFPRKQLELAWCEDCGFIFNQHFEPDALEYSEHCEESQGASPTFSVWLESLVDQLIDEHGMTGQHILEIGCGKAEFLALLCERGNNTGIGYDPAFVEGRHGPAAERVVKLIPKLWDPSKGIHEANVVACRHTFEHIAPVAAFLRDLRKAIAESDTRVFFDLPDTSRVLEEGAFWDIYYEHCSYFTQDSLQRLFRRCGFKVSRLWSDYQDQFLMLLAEPCESGRQEPFEASHMRKQIKGFQQRVAGQLEHWRERLQRAADAGESVALWGGGSKACAFLCRIDGAGHIQQVVDINPHKQGYFIPGAGQPVVAPEALLQAPPDLVIVMNPVYRQEIADQLASMGLGPVIECLG